MHTQHHLGFAKLCIPQLKQVSVRGAFECRFHGQAKEVFAYPLRRRSRGSPSGCSSRRPESGSQATACGVCRTRAAGTTHG